MDSGPAHTTDFTSKWMKDRKVKWIPKEHWFANSLISRQCNSQSMELLKKKLKKHQAYSVDEQVRVAKSEWRKFPIPKIRFALLSWHKRVGLTEKSRGFQLEQNL